ncbi:MAG: DNA recombination protein RmuC [Janthinobacterium lividum]
MLLAIAVLQIILLLMLAVLLLRKPTAPAGVDSRLLTLPDTVASLGGKLDAMDAALRNNVSELRYEQVKTARESRGAADAAAIALRAEIAGNIERLSKTLNDGLGSFRADNGDSAKHLREHVHGELVVIGNRLTTFFNETNRQALGAQDTLHRSLTELGLKNVASHDTLREGIRQQLSSLGTDQRAEQERMRGTVEAGLKTLNTDNAARLEEMRVTVDEKLQSTLNERLTQSFGQVTTHLGEVQKGLGEMKELANGVSDLKRVFSNVKARGIVGEFQLGMQLEQMFSAEQYEKNARIKPNSLESVEYALKIPQGGGTALFPIDSKFPREDWERLEHAYDQGSAEEIAKAGADFERAIRKEGKRICEKYIHEPVTLPHAIMFLPTEGLYAEVMRRPGLQSELQQNCDVTIAGPSTLMAILTSFRMGFTSLEFEKKSSEIRDVLKGVRSEFGKFGDLMGKVEKQVGTVQNTLGEIAGKTKTINRQLRGVDALPDGESSKLLSFEKAGFAPLLAAVGEEEPLS